MVRPTEYGKRLVVTGLALAVPCVLMYLALEYSVPPVRQFLTAKFGEIGKGVIKYGAAGFGTTIVLAVLKDYDKLLTPLLSYIENGNAFLSNVVAPSGRITFIMAGIILMVPAAKDATRRMDFPFKISTRIEPNEILLKVPPEGLPIANANIHIDGDDLKALAQLQLRIPEEHIRHIAAALSEVRLGLRETSPLTLKILPDQSVGIDPRRSSVEVTGTIGARIDPAQIASIEKSLQVIAVSLAEISREMPELRKLDEIKGSIKTLEAEIRTLSPGENARGQRERR